MVPIEMIRRSELQSGKIVLLDKPVDWTSFDVVNKLRGMTKVKKVGHAGTLDPFATGLLLICFASATKQVNQLMELEKEYQGTFELGAETDSHDVTGKIIAQHPVPDLSREHIESATKKYRGEILQTPPMFSALKRDGKKLYELARQGKEVELAARPVKVYAFDILAVSLPEIRFRIACSRGTYIRAIARDLGRDLGCGAFLKTLRRTRVGAYTVADALSIQQFAERLAE